MEVLARRVASASQLLSLNNPNDAFIEYLGCMCLVAQQLSQSKGVLLYASSPSAFDSISQSVTTLFSYARQCLDQSEGILRQEIEEMQEKKLGIPASGQASKRASTDPPSLSSSLTNIPTNQARWSGNSTGSIEGEGKHGDEGEDDMRKKLQNAMREAQEKNVLLLQRYQARVDKLKLQFGEHNPALQAQLSDLSLKFSREYAENYQIAKQKQESILQQVESKKKNIQNLQRLSVDNEYQGRHQPFKVLTKFKHDQKTVKICREMDAEWRKLLNMEGVSEKTVLSYLGHILGLGGHPLGKEAARLVDDTETSLLQLPSAHDPALFKERINSVRHVLHAVADTIIGTYPELDVKAGQDAVRLCVDLVLFPRIYPPLFEWFSQKCQDDDLILDKKYQIFAAVSPAHVGVRRMFWLQEGTAPPATPPYLKAIDTLKRLASMTNTASKMQCLIDTSKAAVDCAAKFYEGKTTQVVIGADDLVPIMSYVIIKAAVRSMHAEISLVEEFIDESLMIGEHGYCLSTFQTCMFYIQSLDWKEADEQHTSLQK